jgi:hypothetical protein
MIKLLNHFNQKMNVINKFHDVFRSIKFWLKLLNY